VYGLSTCKPSETRPDCCKTLARLPKQKVRPENRSTASHVRPVCCTISAVRFNGCPLLLLYESAGFLKVRLSSSLLNGQRVKALNPCSSSQLKRALLQPYSLPPPREDEKNNQCLILYLWPFCSLAFRVRAKDIIQRLRSL